MTLRFTISETPDLKDVLETDCLDIDRDHTVCTILSLGVQQVRIIGERHRLFYQFQTKEIEDIIDKILSNKPLMIDVHKWVSADNNWKNAVTMWKALKQKRDI
jgi:hypothetical protein